ncbi:interleukin-10 receptor subunit beta-like isoform X1 [Anguilla anguilla]|uniref:interleukin-10 receptor subunit beta-like isoform X1 n=1 Tax=Anguilla anguilla TaxID=7936 RepID=UPI0015AAA23C|nr:interleukin-10 receptor subunit beta-like isoform X1 [Anguilla anguilla]
MAYTFLPETCFLVILSVSVVLANLPVPKNVRVISINMGVILEWDRPNTSLGNLTYTAEYRSSDDAGFSTVCRNQTERRCDFTQGIHPFGIYVFQVRAERRGETSRWAKTKEFLPDQETVIGGPTVRLVSREGNLEMDIQDPVMKVKDLIEIYSTVGYNIRYWKEGEEDKATVMNDRQQNSLVLIQLEALSRYCVQVQVFIGEFEKTGEFSQATCETTTTDGRVQAWLIALILVVSFVVVSVALPLLFLVVWYFYKGLKILYPTATLPDHLKRYLMEPPHQYIFMAMQNSSQQEEQYQEVSIISESPLVEEGPLCSHSDNGMTEDGEVLPQNEKE